MGEWPGAILGTRGIVVSGNSLATLTAWQTLERGGSVVDAAVAGASVLAVALPSACTLGGDAFILIHDAGGARTYGINASGPAPAGIDLSRYKDGIPMKGPLSMTVPGVVGGWHAAHRRFGRLDWASLFADAVRLAERGVPITRDTATALRLTHEALASDPGSRAIFLQSGLKAEAGALLKQPALAETLRAIARGGADAFYKGPIAQSLGKSLAAVGGFLRADDLAGYEPMWVEPLETEYRGRIVRVMPPNSYGLFMLLQLNALGGTPMSGLESGSAERFRRLIRAAEIAFKEGDKYVADPTFGAPDARQALSPSLTKKMRAALPERGTADAMPNRGGTAVISVVDGDGNGVTLIQSVFTLFGSAVSDPQTGIVLNDRMIGFSVDPGHPNAVAPSKRPAHTLNPVMVFEADRLRYLLGTPGGPGQTLTLTQVLSNILDLEMDIASAVHAPRWSQGRAGEPALEIDVADDVVSHLQADGISVTKVGPGSPFFGSAEAIEIRPDGVLCGAADHRREAFALGA